MVPAWALYAAAMAFTQSCCVILSELLPGFEGPLVLLRVLLSAAASALAVVSVQHSRAW
jgi:hypothetical protein